MIIAGLQNLSLVDYPGHLAATVFLQGCNFRCGYCQNPDLVTCEKQFEFREKEMFDYLARRKDTLEALVITGGEPTIHNDLPDFITKVKCLGLKVKLDTNGARPRMIEDLLREYLLDYLAIDIKTSFPKYHLIADNGDTVAAVSESIRLAMLSTLPYEFRTTCVPGIVEGEDIKLIGEVVRGAKKYCLQQFRPGVTYDKSFRDVKPYTRQELRDLAGILKEYVEDVEVRGV